MAVSLADELRRETQANVKTDACAGIFPTVTKFGMAALLPNKELTAELKSNGEIYWLMEHQRMPVTGTRYLKMRELYDCDLGCPIQTTLQFISGKWKSVILYHIFRNKVLRFSEL